MRKLLSIVVPVYNEAANIKKTLDLLISCSQCIKEILVVYDFDQDTTVPAVCSLQAAFDIHLRLVKNSFGRGALNAIKTGFMYAESEAVLVIMADMADDLKIIPAMVEAYQQGADVVCGSRYMPGGKQIGGPLLKKIMTRIAGVSLYYLVGIPTRDITNSFKLYRKSFLDSITIESSGGFELGMEITTKAFLQDKTITEIPSVWKDRTVGQSRFRLWAWLPHYLYWYLLLILKRGPHMRFIRLLRLGLMGNKHA